MELFKFEFILRNEFVELKDLFLIFNNMVLTNKISNTDIEVRNYVEKGQIYYYLYVGLHRCKTSFASIRINRNIETISEKTNIDLIKFSNFKKSNKNYFTVFSVAEDNKTVTITIFDIYIPKKIETYTNDNIFDIHTDCLLSLEFYLRKPFKEVTSLISIANRMFAKKASSFITLRPTSDNKKTYLNINILYEDIKSPSLSITVGLIRNSVPAEYQFELAKFNFACSKIPNTSPVFISCNNVDSKHGPMVNIDIFASTNSDMTKEIEKQFKLLDSISPI